MSSYPYFQLGHSKDSSASGLLMNRCVSLLLKHVGPRSGLTVFIVFLGKNTIGTGYCREKLDRISHRGSGNTSSRFLPAIERWRQCGSLKYIFILNLCCLFTILNQYLSILNNDM